MQAPTKTTSRNWLAAAGIAAVLLGAQLLDGPSEADVAQAVASDLKDAQAQAHRDAPAMRAEMARLEAERIEPTPAELLQHYAQLGATNTNR